MTRSSASIRTFAFLFLFLLSTSAILYLYNIIIDHRLQIQRLESASQDRLQIQQQSLGNSLDLHNLKLLNMKPPVPPIVSSIRPGQVVASQRLAGPFFLVIGVFSSCNEKIGGQKYHNETYADRRNVIRETWMSYRNVWHPRKQPSEQILVGFVLGEACALLPEIRKEQSQYGDLMFVEGDDFYQGGKTYRFFQFAASTFLAAFLMKADDDSFLVLPLIERQLRELPTTNIYWGEIVFLRVYAQANVSATRLQEHRGWGYVLSMDLVHRIAETEFPAAFFDRSIFEDCLTGLMLRHLNLTFPDSHLLWSPERFHDPLMSRSESRPPLRQPYPDEVRVLTAKAFFDITSWLGHNCIFFPKLFPILLHVEECKHILVEVHRMLWKYLKDVPNRTFTVCEEFDEIRQLVQPCCRNVTEWNCQRLRRRLEMEEWISQRAQEEGKDREV